MVTESTGVTGVGGWLWELDLPVLQDIAALLFYHNQCNHMSAVLFFTLASYRSAHCFVASVLELLVTASDQ